VRPHIAIERALGSSRRRGSPPGLGVEQGLDPVTNLVADLAHPLDGARDR